MLVLQLLQLSLLVLQVRGMPSGAPAEACSDVYPTGHGGASQDLQENPFSLDLTVLDELGGTLYYVPGETYEIVLSGNETPFRGYLAQARTLADGSPAGTFTASGTEQRLSSCTNPETAVTHSTASDKTEVNMTWTAPANGTGQLNFLFAVVQIYSPSQNINIFWATAETATLHECEFPLYVNERYCVQSCPSSKFGNHMTQQCESYPEDFTVSPNATEYFVSFANDTPLFTAVTTFSVVLNHSYWDSPVDRVFVGLVHVGADDTILDIVGLQSNGADTHDIEEVLILETNREVEFSLYYTMLPPDTISFPYDFSLTLEIRVIGQASGAFFIHNAEGFLNGRITIDPCGTEPCENGATCESIDSVQYMCSCLPGYTGMDCDLSFCQPDTCMNGGTCMEGDGSAISCSCPSGFTDMLCETDIDTYCETRECFNGGTCVEDYGDETSCNCTRGFTGESCEEDDPNELFCEDSNNVCENGGTCNEGFGQETTCTCTSAFTGDLCTEDNPDELFCQDSFCENGGTCIEEYGSNTSCQCVRGFAGNSCTEDDPNELFCGDDSSCANGGTCVEGYGDEISCNCTRGFTGESCEEDDPNELFCEDSINVCENGGTCNEGFGQETTCTCTSAFTGDLCTEDNPDELFCQDSFCENGGTCIEEYGSNTSCQCVRGFAGNSCTEDDPNELFCGDDSSCANGGTCNEGFGPATNCTCVHGFTGDICTEDDPNELFCEDSINVCPNGGTCNEGYGPETNCTCARGFMGDSCEEDDPSELFCDDRICENGGSCNEGFGDTTTCICASGYTGSSCGLDLPFCQPDTCMNGGTCMEGDGSDISCSCPSGFTDMLCETDIDTYCETRECFNGGTCMEGYGNETNCNCTRGFMGHSCEEDDPRELFCENDFCANGGTCTEGFGPETNCTCARGFTGRLCKTDIDTYCETRVCFNGGTCVEGYGDETSCICTPEFTGDSCENDVQSCPAEENVSVYPGSQINYNWPQTGAGSKHSYPCPDICQTFINYPPEAMVVRVCHKDTSAAAEWLNTDITACGFSATALELCEANQLGSDAEVAAAVVNITSSTSSLESSAITVVGDIILDLTDAAIEEPEVRDNFLNAIDNVLEANTDDLLMSQTESNSSTKILEGLNRFLDLVPVDNETGNATFTFNNFGIIALIINDTVMQQTFSANLGPVMNAVTSNKTIAGDQLLVTSKLISDTTGSISSNNLDSCSQSSGDQRVAYSVFRTNALFLTPETACEESTVGSIIMGVRMNGTRGCNTTSVIVDLQQLTEVCRGMLTPMPTLNTKRVTQTQYDGVQLSSDQESICSNYAVDETDGVGRWSSDSCKKIKSDGQRTVCDCSQLGHFGLLFDLNPGDSLSPLALAVISYIGAILSVVCLIIVTVTYLSSKHLRRTEHGRLLVHLSVSLICIYLVFIIAGLVTSVEGLCGLVSALFQYFMLVFFGWTAAEAVILYYRLVKVLGKPIEHFVLKAALIVWLAPLVIVLISVAPGHKHYVNPYYCRATEWPFWFGLILPFAITYIFNWSVFTIIIFKLLHRNTFSKSDAKPKKTTTTVVKQNLIIAAGLSLLFGLGWGFGLTATSSDVEELTFAFQVLFSLFVGSQGVLIFVFHGIRSPQFRQVWVSLFGLRSRLLRKSYVLSSNLPPKKPIGPSSSTTYNMGTLTATGTLPSDLSSKHQKKELLHSSEYSRGFSSIELESEFEKLTVIANETEMKGGRDHETVMDKEQKCTEMEGNSKGDTEIKGESKGETGVKGNSKVETEVEGNSKGETEMEGSSKGETEVEGSSKGETEMEGSSKGETEVEGSSKGKTEMEGNSKGKTEMEGNSKGDTEIKGESKGETGVEGNSKGETEMEGSSKGETEVEGSSKGNTEMEGSSKGETEVEGNSKGETEMEGSSKGETEVEGSSKGNTEMEGSSKGETEVEGNSKGETEMEGSSKGETKIEGDHTE